jgi:diguanylate cyclase (GGDEF)-like protein
MATNHLAELLLAPIASRNGIGVVALGHVTHDFHNFETVDQHGLVALSEALAAVLQLESLSSSVDELESQRLLMWHQANRDALTGVANRLRFNDLLGHALLRRSPNLAVVYLDLDNLKKVNDSFGHEAGDRLIINAARHLSSCVRQEDTVARIGGDEFAIILENIAPQDAEALTARIVNGFRELFDTGNSPVIATVSAGYAYAEPGESASELVARADKALYQAKHDGRARLVIASS